MIEKLQAWGLAAKNFFLWILTPILFVVGCMFLLWKKEEDLEVELAETKADAKLKGLQDAQKQEDAVATAAVSDYEQLRSQYLKDLSASLTVPPTDSSGGQGDSGSKGPSGNT